MTAPLYISLEKAKTLLGQERPRRTGQIIIRQRCAGRDVEVRLGIIPSHGRCYHRITKAGVKYKDFKFWTDALQQAITRAEELIQNPKPNPQAMTISGVDFRAWLRLQDLAPQFGLTVSQVPDFLESLRQQINNQTKEHTHE